MATWQVTLRSCVMEFSINGLQYLYLYIFYLCWWLVYCAHGDVVTSGAEFVISLGGGLHSLSLNAFSSLYSSTLWSADSRDTVSLCRSVGLSVVVMSAAEIVRYDYHC